MVTYNIGILPLIQIPKEKFPQVTQPWYSENVGALGKFTNVELYFNLLKRSGPGYGYSPQTSKIILIVQLYNPTTRKRFGLRHGFKVCTGARYLGGFIGDNVSKHKCLKVRTKI